MGVLTRLLVAAVIVQACSDVTRSPARGQSSGEAELGPIEGILIGAGDIADCDIDTDEATAQLLDEEPGIVFTLGDNVYESGTPSEFLDCYEPSWGRHKLRTRPAPGNHDYGVDGAAAYFAYFGRNAGPPGLGYYSYEVGPWHVVVLNSICVQIGGCGVSSAQTAWLRSDLKAHRRHCTIAYAHYPRFSGGFDGPHPTMDPIFRVLYQEGVELFLAGHAHNYERFLPQDPDTRFDPARGVTQIVVGTGGKQLTLKGRDAANSAVFNNDTYGVLKVTLRTRGYEWRFIPVAGGSLSDSGAARCH